MNMAARATLYVGSDDSTKGHIVASGRILVTMVLGKNQDQFSQSTLEGSVMAVKARPLQGRQTRISYRDPIPNINITPIF